MQYLSSYRQFQVVRALSFLKPIRLISIASNHSLEQSSLWSVSLGHSTWKLSWKSSMNCTQIMSWRIPSMRWRCLYGVSFLKSTLRRQYKRTVSSCWADNLSGTLIWFDCLLFCYLCMYIFRVILSSSFYKILHIWFVSHSYVNFWISLSIWGMRYSMMERILCTWVCKNHLVKVYYTCGLCMWHGLAQLGYWVFSVGQT